MSTQHDQKRRILIVDDDEEIRELLANFLSEHNFAVFMAANGIEMSPILNANAIDAVILDIMMPGDDGFILCKKIRAHSNVPIIMLTAITEDTDRIIGLELGADDYMTKPFNPRELLARLKAVLRRTATLTEESVTPPPPTRQRYVFSGWHLDKAARHLTSPEGIEIILSTGEFDLLAALLEHPQQVLSRDLLLDMTRNRAAGPYDRSVDVQVSRLRQKIERDPKKPTLIKTVRGGGYIFTEPVEIQILK